MTKPKKIMNFESAHALIKRIGGDDALQVVKIYERKGKMVTDEELAKKMRLKVTEVRTILNRLHYRGVACYQKSKNTKTGWYSYTWEIKKKRVAELLLEEMVEKTEKLEAKQQMQSNYGLFSCSSLCGQMPFEVAAEYDFKCPECGAPMDMLDSKKMLKRTQKELEGLKVEKMLLEKAI